MQLVLRSVEDRRDLERLRGFLGREENAQSYPDYNAWVNGVCIPGVKEGDRQAIIAVNRGIVVGDVVWRFLKGRAIEIKNFRIDQSYGNRHLGRFLLRQAEHEAFEGREGRVSLDVSVNNFSGVRFFILQGFKPVGVAELYRTGQPEYLMEKLVLGN